jgi:hypothetical protein
MAVTLRNYRGPEDIDLQNAFWMQATRELPWCWKPTISPSYIRERGAVRSAEPVLCVRR